MKIDNILLINQNRTMGLGFLFCFAQFPGYSFPNNDPLDNSAIPSEKSISDKLNIVFLLADNIRWNSFGCMGTPLVHSPNIDRLASEGIRFTKACVTTSICMASRASILTGQYMSRHGINVFGKPLNEQAFSKTYPAILREAGYWTGFVGKYGVGEIRESDFDFAASYFGNHWVSDGNGDSIHVTVKNANDAISFINERPKSKPFCLSVSFHACHPMDNHPDKFLYQPQSERYYRNDTIPIPKTATEEHYNSLPPFIRTEENEGRVRWRWHFETYDKYQTQMKAYYRMLTEMDHEIGRIITELKNQGVYENTLVIFMADNGFIQGEKGLAHYWYPYEESIRIPLIVYDPRNSTQRRNITNEEFVLNIDVAPTILSAAGLKIPKAMQGSDFSKLYVKHSAKWRKEFYYEHSGLLFRKTTVITDSEALVTHKDKYIYWPDYQYEEYFNLLIDPLEEFNAIDEEKYSSRIEYLKKRFDKLKKKAK